MITLHRLGHKLELFRLNPDLIVTVEATPDTVLTLATGAKIVVAETPERVAKVSTVSGVASTVTIKSGLSRKSSSLCPRRCNVIMVGPRCA